MARKTISHSERPSTSMHYTYSPLISMDTVMLHFPSGNAAGKLSTCCQVQLIAGGPSSGIPCVQSFSLLLGILVNSKRIKETFYELFRTSMSSRIYNHTLSPHCHGSSMFYTFLHWKEQWMYTRLHNGTLSPCGSVLWSHRHLICPFVWLCISEI